MSDSKQTPHLRVYPHLFRLLFLNFRRSTELVFTDFPLVQILQEASQVTRSLSLFLAHSDSVSSPGHSRFVIAVLSSVQTSRAAIILVPLGLKLHSRVSIIFSLLEDVTTPCMLLQGHPAKRESEGEREEEREEE